MYLGSVASETEAQNHSPYFASAAHEMAENPTVVEIGFAPVRVTLPLTSEARKEEAWAWGIGIAVTAGLLLWVGGTAAGKLVQTVRGLDK